MVVKRCYICTQKVKREKGRFSRGPIIVGLPSLHFPQICLAGKRRVHYIAGRNGLHWGWSGLARNIMNGGSSACCEAQHRSRESYGITI